MGFVLVPEFTLIAFASFIDALRLAADEEDRSRPIECNWTVLGEDIRPIRSSSGIEICPSEQFGNPARFDYIVVVGGLLQSSRKISNGIYQYLKLAAKHGVPLVGVCTGSFVLARAGLMTGYTSCVLWLHHRDFVMEFPKLHVVSDQLYVVDRDRLTCAGGTSVAHMAAHLIERHVGLAQAAKCLRIMVEEAPLPARSPQPQPEFTVETDNSRVRSAMWLMERNVSTPPMISEIAEQIHTSVRQLQRDFRAALGISPNHFFMELRLRHTKWLLEHTSQSIAEIAQRCGFSDSAHFSRTFRKSFGHPPTKFRSSHKAESPVMPSE